MKVQLLFLLMLMIGFTAEAKAPSSSLDSNNTKQKSEYFFFQTTGDPSFLLSNSAYEAIKLSAKLSGYNTDEIEVTITVTDKKSKKTRSKMTQQPKVRKPKIKKFE